LFIQFKIKKMRINKSILSLFIAAGLMVSCNSELDVKNPNLPTPESTATPNGIIAFASGGVYINGFRGLADKYNDGVPGYFWSGAMGMHELWGDNIGEEAANWYGNQIACPNQVVLDNGAVVKNPSSPNTQYALMREVNQNSNQGSNPGFHEWANMYGLNNACNNMLEIVEKVTFPTDDAAKKATIKAWAYWWKGFAYSHIGSIYYAGLINNVAGKASNVFVTKEAIIAESNKNFDAAAGLIKGLGAGTAAYSEIMGKVIPSFCQVEKGKVPTPAMWLRSINTMKARNILANKTVAAMTAADWTAVATLTADGIGATDNVFTGRSTENAEIWNPLSGSVASKSTGATPGSNTYKISERLVQDFKATDKRLANNFVKGTAWLGNADRGIIFNTRYLLKDGGTGVAGTIVYSNRTAGATELYLAGSYEENALMLAEAKIYSNDIEGGLGLIDAVRTAQGAGLAAVKGTSLSLAAAKEELRVERRCALVFRGVAFYDARRWGVIEPSATRTKCVVVDKAGVVNTNATITYGYLDYLDVPDNELAYNPVGAGSAPVVNPKK
jgi:starch-binding outer membrane protein, SusD/RagB family